MSGPSLTAINTALQNYQGQPLIPNYGQSPTPIDTGKLHLTAPSNPVDTGAIQLNPNSNPSNAAAPMAVASAPTLSTNEKIGLGVVVLAAVLYFSGALKG